MLETIRNFAVGSELHAKKARVDHFHWRLYLIRVNCPRKSTLNKDIMVDQKTHLTRDTDQMSRSKQGWLQFYMISYTQNHDCFNILYPKVNEDVDSKKETLLSIRTQRLALTCLSFPRIITELELWS